MGPAEQGVIVNLGNRRHCPECGLFMRKVDVDICGRCLEGLPARDLESYRQQNAPEPSGPVESSPPPVAARCPRCGNLLYSTSMEPLCLTCGYQDYTKSSRRRTR